MMRIYLMVFILWASLFGPSLGQQLPSLCASLEGSQRDIDSLIPPGLRPLLDYREATKYYFGDHVKWDELEAFDLLEKHWDERLIRDSKFLHDELMEFLEKEAGPPVEVYKHYPIFRAPKNVNDLWLTEVSLASDNFVHQMDKLNIMANGGIFTNQSNHFRQYKEFEDRLTVLRNMSSYFHIGMDTLEKYKVVIQSKETQMMVEAYIDKNIKTDAKCLYDYLVAKNVTLFNTFIEVVSEERFVGYINEFASEAMKVVKSSQTEMNFNSIISAVNKTTQNLDVDSLFGKTNLVFLRSRALVLGIDLRQVFTDLDDVHRQIGEGWTSLVEGQWPEMKSFISKFLSKTLGSKKFWYNLNKVYHDQVKYSKKMYIEREKRLEKLVRQDLVKFLKSLLKQMTMLRTANSQMIEEMVTVIEATDVNSIIEPIMDKLTAVMSKHFLACTTRFYGKPDFTQLERLVESNSITKFVKDLVVSDWPEQEKIPKSFKDFVEKFQSGVMLIVTASLGSCSRPNYI